MAGTEEVSSRSDESREPISTLDLARDGLADTMEDSQDSQPQETRSASLACWMVALTEEGSPVELSLG